MYFKGRLACNGKLNGETPVGIMSGYDRDIISGWT